MTQPCTFEHTDSAVMAPLNFNGFCPVFSEGFLSRSPPMAPMATMAMSEPVLGVLGGGFAP